jgi:hypothetical protein
MTLPAFCDVNLLEFLHLRSLQRPQSFSQFLLLHHQRLGGPHSFAEVAPESYRPTEGRAKREDNEEDQEIVVSRLPSLIGATEVDCNLVNEW